MMEIKIIDPINNNSWLNFIYSHPRADIFNHPAWFQVLRQQYKYKVFAVVKADSSGMITAGIPFCEVKNIFGTPNWLSLPFSDHCKPLYNSKEDLLNLIDSIITESRLKNVKKINICAPVNGNIFPQEEVGTNHFLNIENTEEEMMRKADRSKRQGIKKALRENLTFEITSQINSIARFYKLHLITRRKLGVPIQPRKFFEHVFVNIISRGMGFIIFIKKENKDIAAGMFFNFNNKLFYKYNASDPDYLIYRPNNLIIWAAIKYGIQNNISILDFGRTESTNAGLREFKMQWGCQEEPLIYSSYPEVNRKNVIRTAEKKILASIIKISPLVVCQLAGEIIYKFLPMI